MAQVTYANLTSSMSERKCYPRLLAWMMFGEQITGQVWLGGALILGSNAVLLARRIRPR